jgi:sterol 3beta-glucosyltransferase
MRFVIVTYGSQGDIRPLAALGAGLVRAGHDVVFPADRGFRPLIERAGLAYAPLSGDLHAAIGGDAATTLFWRARCCASAATMPRPGRARRSTPPAAPMP